MTFPHVRCEVGGGLEESPGLLHLALPHLQHSKIVVTLRMIVVGCQGKLECLVGKVNIPDAKGEMSNIVPNLLKILNYY